MKGTVPSAFLSMAVFSFLPVISWLLLINCKVYTAFSLFPQLLVIPQVAASKTLVSRDAILGRVVEFEEAMPVLCGVHPNPVPPMSGAKVVNCIRRRLIEAERLRQYKPSRYLIACWEEEVKRLRARPTRAPLHHHSPWQFPAPALGEHRDQQRRDFAGEASSRNEFDQAGRCSS